MALLEAVNFIHKREDHDDLVDANNCFYCCRSWVKLYVGYGLSPTFEQIFCSILILLN